MHVETIVGQCDAGPALDAVSETSWIASQLATGSIANREACAIVAFASLAAPANELAAQLNSHTAAAAAAGVRLAGVRMILNFDAGDSSLCWPQVAHGDFMAGNAPPALAWRAGLAELAARGLSFDLQCNPPQLAEAAAAFAATPGLCVIVNHLGCPRLGRGADADAIVLGHWRAGMTALASNASVFVKVSMLTFIRDGWLVRGSEARAQIAALVHETIALFGAHRVMFASNFPVDKITTGSLAEIYSAFREIACIYSADQQRDLFANSAARAFGLTLVA